MSVNNGVYIIILIYRDEKSGVSVLLSTVCHTTFDEEGKRIQASLTRLCRALRNKLELPSIKNSYISIHGVKIIESPCKAFSIKKQILEYIQNSRWMTRLGNSDAYISAEDGTQIIADNEDEDDEICDVMKLEKDFTNKFKNEATSPENVIKGTYFHTVGKDKELPSTWCELHEVERIYDTVEKSFDYSR